MTSTSGCRVAGKIYLRGIEKANGNGDVISHWKEWSDDLDPNYNKSGRGSVWIKTITFSRTGKGQNSCECTHLVAVGPKGGLHDEVKKIHAQEMKELRENKHSFYSKFHDKFVHVHMEMLVSMGDQPERRAGTGIVAGPTSLHLPGEDRSSEVVARMAKL